jgi:hypothetical protein
MRSDQNPPRFRGLRPALLAIIAVVMAISYFAFSAPPRRGASRSGAARRGASRSGAPRRTHTGRPRPAHRPGRHHAPVRPGAVAHPRRIGTLRPVVLGSTGTVVVSDPTPYPTVVPVPVEVPVETTTTTEEVEAQSSGETVYEQYEEQGAAPAESSSAAPADRSTAAPAESASAASSSDTSAAPAGDASAVPSDADDSMADAPSYKVLGVEDNGLTIVVDVDGQETKVRMIGLAEAQDDDKSKNQDSPRGPLGRGGPGKHMANRRGPGRGAPRLPTEIFLKNMLQGEEVYIVYDSMVEEQDEDGKYVAYVYRAPDGMLLNTEVLRQGFGVVDPGYDFSEKDTFEYYQGKAQQAKKGLWSRFPLLNRISGGGMDGPRRGPLGKPDGVRK